MRVTHFNDPGCPWGYSAMPAFTTLEWRYGDALEWRLRLIGIGEDAEHYSRRGYTPARMALGYHRRFRRLGMPFQTAPRPYVPGTGRACRAVVATRLVDPACELAAFRALQFGWFAAPLVLDRDDHIATALGRVRGLDVDAVVGAIDDPAVEQAYAADRAAARTAAGGPAERQGKTATTDGPVRYTAPTLIFEAADGRRLEAGGWQPLEAYDVLIANLDPTLARRPAPADPLEALEAFPRGLATQELAAVMAEGNDPPDRAAAEAALIELAAERLVRRVPLGDDALWVSPSALESALADARYAAGSSSLPGA